ncbi:hypothetical protein pb186bvf_019064 [Paramecium bursaria]
MNQDNLSNILIDLQIFIIGYQEIIIPYFEKIIILFIKNEFIHKITNCLNSNCKMNYIQPILLIVNFIDKKDILLGRYND